MSDATSAEGSPAGRNSYAAGPLLAGPMLGEVGPDDAHIWVQARDASELTLELSGSDGSERSLTATPSAAQWLCVVFHVADLTAESYEYSLRSAHGQTRRYPLPRGLPPEARRLKLALGSCYKDYQRPELPIFARIAAEEPALFLMLGDNCYFVQDSDWNSEQGMMLAHLRNRNHDSLRPLLARTPTLGIWDDHDFGPNDSDGTFAHKEAALRSFKRMWAQRSYGTAETPGIFSAVRCGPVELFLTDDRYERSSRRHILGAAQLDWLKQRLRASSAAVKLVLCGSQVLAEAAALPHFDWECWRRDAGAELEELIAFIAQEDIRGVLLASGDPHLGQILHARGRKLEGGRIGPELWELTTSPLAHVPWHEQMWPADSREPRFFDRHLLTELAAENYGIIDLDLDRPGEELRLQLKDAQGATFHSQSVALAALQVRQQAPRRTVVRWNEQRVYVFKDAEYVRYDLAEGPGHPPEARSPRPITAGWKGVFPEQPGVDAVLVGQHGKAYFFQGNGYVRYDIAADHADSGYPKYTARHFPGVWADGLHAAAAWTDGKAYFFKGGECLRYDLGADRADPGYPRPLAAEFPGLAFSAVPGEPDGPEGIDSAVLWGNGKAYFFCGREYVRYDLAEKRPDPGYPRPLSDDWLGISGEPE